MKTLVIYDSTGRIWFMAHGETEAPQGLLCMFVDIPDGAILSRIDVTNADDPQPVFEYLPETDIGRLQVAVKNLESENVALKAEAKNLKADVGVNLLAASYVAETFTDEQALNVPTLYDNWTGDSASYKTGKRLRYNGVLYKVLQDHTSQADWTPEAAPSLFAKVLIEDPNVVSEWVQPDSTNGYSVGDKVLHNGIIYESLVDNNVWEPGATGTETCWKAVTV